MPIGKIRPGLQDRVPILFGPAKNILDVAGDILTHGQQTRPGAIDRFGHLIGYHQKRNRI